MEWLISAMYRSLFLAGDMGYRRAHFLSKLVFIFSVILFISRNPGKSYLLIPIALILGYIYPGLDWVIAVTGLTALIGVFLSTSAYILSLLGLYEMTMMQILEVVLRTMGIGISIVFSFTIISPLELYNILFYLKGRRIAVFPLLLWRLTPLGLRNFIDSLLVGYLKRELPARRIPSAVASMLEAGFFIEEYCSLRLRTGTRISINIERSYRYTTILLLISLLITFIQYM